MKVTISYDVKECGDECPYYEFADCGAYGHPSYHMCRKTKRRINLRILPDIPSWCPFREKGK